MSKGRSSKKIIGKKPNTANSQPINWGNIAMPLVKRVFAQTIGVDLVSVQPLSAPIGNLMYMDSSLPTATPLEILQKAIELWRADRNNQLLENKVRKCLDDALPGLSNQAIDRAIEDDAFMDELVKINRIAEDYGI